MILRTVRARLGIVISTMILSAGLGGAPAEADSIEDLARHHVAAEAAARGLEPSDVADLVVSSRYRSRHTGVTHLVFQQRLHGLPVIGALSTVNVTADGRTIAGGVRLAAGLSRMPNPVPALAPRDAVAAAVRHSELGRSGRMEVVERSATPDRASRFRAEDGRWQASTALGYAGLEDGDLRLAWVVAVTDSVRHDRWRVLLNATSGATLDVIRPNVGMVPPDLELRPTAAALEPGRSARGAAAERNGAVHGPGLTGYRVYPVPMESPNHLLPPAADDPPLAQDNRSLVEAPASAGSPYGWHDVDGQVGADFTITRGNNVHAFLDSNGDSQSSGDEPDGGVDLLFDFPIDLTQDPSSYVDASVTDVFFWINRVHDLFYAYGFDEAAGTYQDNNYGNAGVGGDGVTAAVLWPSNCNAIMDITEDGVRPVLKTYPCNVATPARDGGLDHGATVWSWAQPMAHRLVGGPSTVACLNNVERMDTGFADYAGLWMTMEPGDDGSDSRGFGTYLFGQPTTGAGIRPFPYSTDFSVNPSTYGDISGQAVPHGVGSVWATMLWEMTWDLMDEYGFDPDLTGGDGGNTLAMQLVVDGLKLTPCSPGFVDARDAILDADVALTGGDNRCTIWRAFARRGLGLSADQGSSGSTADGTEAFDVPSECSIHFYGGFESGGTCEWSSVTPDPGCEP